jgi:uncharacterized membrane protein (UPF0127 family)
MIALDNARVTTEMGQLVVVRLVVARTHWQKFVGWMMKPRVTQGEGLLITHCQSVHCMFMRFPIDVLFIDSVGIVVHVVHKMRPWTVSPVVWKAEHTLECFPGTAEAARIEPGVQLVFHTPDSLT